MKYTIKRLYLVMLKYDGEIMKVTESENTKIYTVRYSVRCSGFTAKVRRDFAINKTQGIIVESFIF